MTSEGEADWVRRARAGDRKAYEQLVARYYGPLVRRVRRLVGDYHLAQDVAQEALLRAHEGLRSLDDPDNFGRWLLRIGRNIAVDRVRQASRRQELEFMEPHDMDRQTCVSEASVTGEGEQHAAREARRLWSAVASLPERDRHLLLLRFGRGLTQAQVAEECGLSLSVVKVALHRGRARLARLLAAEQRARS